MSTRILVPLDGSRLAEEALPCATRLGQDLQADLVLLHVVSRPASVRRDADEADPRLSALVDESATRARDYLQGIAHSLRNTNPNVRHVVRYGCPQKVIVDYAAKTDIDQIIMATNSYGSHNRWRNSSVAERVVQRTSAPVLLVRCREPDSRWAREPESWRRVLVPLDGSQKAEHVLASIAQTSQALGLELILFQVSIAFLFDISTRAADRMAKAYLNLVAERLRNQGILVSTAVRTGPVVETIVQFVRANDVDLIAMSTHARTGIARWILGSVAAQVFREGSTPVLLLRAQRQFSRQGLLPHRSSRVPCIDPARSVSGANQAGTSW